MGVATIFGFIGVTALMVLVTLLSYAVLPRVEIAGLQQPSMATVLEAVVGHWGLVFISLAVIVSVLGAYLAWQMIAAEVLFSAAKTDDMPSIFATENQNKVLGRRPMAQQRHRPALCHQHAVLGGRVYADAQIVHFDVVDSLSAGGRLWAADCRRGETYNTRAQERNRRRRSSCRVFPAKAGIFSGYRHRPSPV